MARAIADMTEALRQRIDGVEAFAADVAHEIKNPLASLRSALDTLDKVGDGDLRRQLHAIAAHDVQRIDRLVTEIAYASRIDAELSRTTFDVVDLLALATALAGERERRGVNRDCVVVVTHEGSTPPVVEGDAARLERVFENLIDNAVSFSPPGGTITVALANHGLYVSCDVTDEGRASRPPRGNVCSSASTRCARQARISAAIRGWGWPSRAPSSWRMTGSCMRAIRWKGRRRTGAARGWCSNCPPGIRPRWRHDVAPTIDLRGDRRARRADRRQQRQRKSSLALALIDRGAALVGDDGVALRVESGVLLASPAPATRGLIEVRGVGLVPMAAVENMPVALLIRLTHDAPRYVETPRREDILGVDLPLLELYPDSPVLALRATIALDVHGLPVAPLS
jgi:two-component system sensor histidine kinase ChvG